MNKNTLLIGFTLFAFFFGSGNLIFPPKLGVESGEFFIPAIIGFVITGAGLPLIAIIIGSKYQKGYESAFARIHPFFSIVLLSAIYLTIGPFFAIPRTGAVAYEMSLSSFLDKPSWVTLLAFTTIYYAISLWLSLNPSKLIDRIGALLTPLLILIILALIIASFIKIGKNPSTIAIENYKHNAFFKGFFEGYQTMDLLGSVAFSVLILNAVKQKVSGNLISETAKAGFIAAAGLALVYLALGWIGNHLVVTSDELNQATQKGQNVGTYLLNKSSEISFGSLGSVVIGLIASLACLTTTIGLTTATSEYFSEKFPIGESKSSYKIYAVIFTLIGFIIANQGLGWVISKSIPVLLVLYPISITALSLAGVNLLIKLPVFSQRGSILLVTIASIMSVAGVKLPLQQYGMEWLPFAIVGFILGLIIDLLTKKKINLEKN